jgi:hypothetical protein
MAHDAALLGWTPGFWLRCLSSAGIEFCGLRVSTGRGSADPAHTLLGIFVNALTFDEALTQLKLR